jgi:serine protease inhibitor
MFNSPLSKNTEMIICNIIYFKSNWKIKFDKSDTIDKNFNFYQNKVLEIYLEPR